MPMAHERSTEKPAGPLVGLRVLDLSNSPAGAQASQTLADFGAEVLCVEPPGGSVLRSLPSFPLIARGKQSMVLDLHDTDDAALARRLALGADVLIETFRPGVAERLGLGHEELSKENPRLVYGSVTAFGRTGPYAGAKGYEALVMARLGALWASESMVEREGPAHVSMPYCAYGASQQLLAGICAALHERETSGRGQRVEATLVNGLAALGTWNWYLNVITSKFPDAFTPSATRSAAGLPLSPMSFMLLIALSGDGRWMQFSQVQLHLYMEMLKVFGLDWMPESEEWKAAVWAADTPKTGEYWDKLFEAVQSKSLAEWNEVFENDHDVWAETMRRGSELLDHPQMRHLGAVVEIDDAERGLVRQPGPVVAMAETPAVLSRGAPELNADGARLRATPWGPLDAEVSPSDSDSDPASASQGSALGDITLLELGTFFAAPFGGTVLRELGARVIKVEPLGGEPMRNLLPFPEVGGAKCLQGKESICVDLSTDEGRAIVHELARRSDLVLQSFRAGVAERQGVDAATLRAVNPDLIYLNSPGYGIDGPCGDRPAYAPTIGAGSGLVMRNIGSAIEERPGLSLKEIRAEAIRLAGAGTTEYAQADGISALTAASVMTLGLLVRDRTGTAQQMLTTMLTSTAHALADDMVEYKERPPTLTADAQLLGYSARYRLYRAADEWVYLAAPNAGEWAALCTVLADAGVADLAADARFATEEARVANDGALAGVLEGVFATNTAQYWEDTLLAADVGCMVAHRNPPESVLQSEQFARAADLLVEVDHPTFGEHVRLKPYVSFSRSTTVAEPGSLAGQHTEAILSELGYSAEAIADLRDRKVVA
jgi:crotonobetainyl-CoA:carnitine CoA-transferase CaiB-like acyl-CoA transferase